MRRRWPEPPSIPPEPLRIAQVAPGRGAVRRGVGESVQQHVWLLCEELVARGHQVTLFASGDSSTSAELRSFFERGHEFDQQPRDGQASERMHVAYAYAHADEFDLIHSHSNGVGLPFAPQVRTPNVHTHHVAVEPGVVEAYRCLKGAHVVVPSAYQATRYGDLPNLEVIPRGIDTDAYPFFEVTGGYLLFLGRMTGDEGPAQAIELGRTAGMPVVLAGPADDGFEPELAAQIDGRRVAYVGRVSPRERRHLLAGAAALLYPPQHPERFGLDAVAAMACGTPVLGIEVGAVPELVDSGLTGYLAPSWHELGALVPRALELDRRAIRRHAAARFDYRLMVDRHEALYRRLVAEDAGELHEPRSGVQRTVAPA